MCTNYDAPTRISIGMIQPDSRVLTSSRHAPGVVGVNSKSAVSPGPVRM
jgi:hypothetical protein